MALTKAKREVPVELLDECFLYEQSTGALYWKERPLKHFCGERQQKTWNKRFSGKRAGSVHGRYRVVDRGVNCSNREFKKSKLGVTGVKRDGKKFIARKQINGIRVYLGTFGSIEEAKLAYDLYNGRNG